MNTMKGREPRKPVRIVVRLVTDAGWTNAEIRNVSSGGLMATCSSPPARGSYVELRRETYSVIGRVVWSSDGRFGIQAQQKVSLPHLTHPAPRSNAECGERRRRARPQESFQLRRATSQERAEANGRRGRAMEFVAVLAIVAGFAYLVADQALNTLATPLKTAGSALGTAALHGGD
jgi:hypothetical protein